MVELIRSTNEDIPVTFTASDFPSALTRVQILELPLSGVLQLNTIPVTTYQEILSAEFSHLTYEPTLNFNGRVRFRWQGHDGVSYSIPDGLTTIHVAPVNDTPTDIGLSATTIAENVPFGTRVGLLSTLDPDGDNTFTYELRVGPGDADNADFAIVGSELRLMASPDREIKSGYTVRIRTTDQNGLFLEKVVAIAVSNLPEPPTDIRLTKYTVDEHVPEQTLVGRLSTVDSDIDNTYTYELVQGLGDTDNALFTIRGNALQLNPSPDFETKPTYSLRVRSTDNTGLGTEKFIEVTINDLPESPTDIALSRDQISENVAPNTLIGTLTAIDVDVNNAYTYELVDGEGAIDNTAFVINGNQLRIKASPDREEKDRYSIRVRTQDNTGLLVDKIFTITINNVNEPPTNILLSNRRIHENSPAASLIGTLDTVDPDINNTFTYRLVEGDGDADNSFFTIRNNQLILRPSPDFEEKNQYRIRLRSTDQSRTLVEKAFTILVDDVNEAPGELELSHQTLDENVAPGTVVGTLRATDLDEGDRLSFSLVDGLGAADNEAFTVEGTRLILKSTPNFEAQSEYRVRLQVKDRNGLTFERSVVVAVQDINEKPLVAEPLPDLLIPVNSAIRYRLNSRAFEEPDGDRLTFSATLSDRSPLPQWLKFDPKTRSFSGKADRSDLGSLEVRVVATDKGQLAAAQTFKMRVADVYDAQKAKQGLAATLDWLNMMLRRRLLETNLPLVKPLDKGPTFLELARSRFVESMGSLQGIRMPEFKAIVEKSLTSLFPQARVVLNPMQGNDETLQIVLTHQETHRKALPKSLELPGLKVQGRGTANTELFHTVALTVGFDKNHGFFVDTQRSSLRSQARVSLGTNFGGTAQLGSLALDVQAKTGQPLLTASLRAHFQDMNQDGDHLTLKELLTARTAKALDRLFNNRFSTDSQIRLNAQAAAIDRPLAGHTFQLMVDNSAQFYRNGKLQGVAKPPVVRLERMQFDLNTFLNTLVGPILTRAQTTLAPVRAATEFWLQRNEAFEALGLQPYVDQNGDDQITLLETLSTITRTAIDTRLLDMVQAIDRAYTLWAQISAGQNGAGKLDLGSWVLNGFDPANPSSLNHSTLSRTQNGEGLTTREVMMKTPQGKAFHALLNTLADLETMGLTVISQPDLTTAQLSDLIQQLPTRKGYGFTTPRLKYSFNQPQGGDRSFSGWLNGNWSTVEAPSQQLKSRNQTHPGPWLTLQGIGELTVPQFTIGNAFSRPTQADRVHPILPQLGNTLYSRGLPPISTASGTLQFALPITLFDRNGNGRADRPEVRLTSVTGTDVFSIIPVGMALNMPATLTLQASLSSWVELVAAPLGNPHQADLQVKAALGLPANLALTTNPVTAILDNNTDGAILLSAQLQMQTAIALITHLIQGTGSIPVADVESRLIAVVADYIRTGQPLLLTDATVLKTLVESTVSSLQLTYPALQWQSLLAISGEVATVIAQGNQRIEYVTNTVPLSRVLKRATQIQTVLLTQTAADLRQVVRGTQSLKEAIANNTGQGFDTALVALNAPSPILITPGSDRNDLLRGNPTNPRTDILSGRAGHDILLGLNGDDVLSGNTGRDRLEGGQGDDFLRGGSGQDSLWGGSGHDTLMGGSERDRLTGGTGRDVFHLNPFQPGADRITDFNPTEDIIAIDFHGSFPDRKRYTSLPSHQFQAGQAMDGRDRFIYHSTHGTLFYDPDGTGKAQPVAIGQLTPGLSLTAAHVVWA